MLAGDDAGDADEEWVTQTTHGIRIGVPAAVLLALVLVAGGFWGGAALEKSHGGGSSSLLASAGVPLQVGGRRSNRSDGSQRSRQDLASAGLFGGERRRGDAGRSPSSTATRSTSTTPSTGSLVKVTLTKSTTVTRNADASAVDLRPGDTVIVQGATGSSGAVTATSVSATAPGVSSGFAGFGRGAADSARPADDHGPSTGSTTTTTPSLFGG